MADEDKARDQLRAIQQALDRLEAKRPSRNDPAYHRAGKVPYKVTDYRASLLWRFAELVRSALESYERDRLAVATLVTRAAIESATALWYLNSKVRKAIEANKLGELDTSAMRLLLGRRNNPHPKAPKAINVLDFVDQFERELKAAGYDTGLRTQYEDLSEVAHPNWEGTHGLYANPSRDHKWTDFGIGARNEVADFWRGNGVAALAGAVNIFEHADAELDELLPPLRALCEREVAALRASKPSESNPNK